jgi:aldose 1-epimerase
MIKRQIFGYLEDGQEVEQYSLINRQGMQLDILTLGGIVRRWLVPNSSQSESIDIVLGFDQLSDYLTDSSYLGAIVGRYANRINQGRFSLNGQVFQVDVNQGGHCLHGGSDGFNQRVFKASCGPDEQQPSLILELTSADGDQGFPGNMTLKIIYTLTEQNKVKVEYFAQSDKPTVFNPTLHSYFNLAGHDSGSVRDHQVQVLASQFTPSDEQAIPTGQILPVSNSPFDLQQLSYVHQALASPHQQIVYGHGLDHNWCLDNFEPATHTAKYAAKVVCEQSALQMKIYTSMPGIQIFSANHFSDMPGKEGATYQQHQGLCFETQFYPDSPNQPHFPSSTLAADSEFYAVTEFVLSNIESAQSQ